MTDSDPLREWKLGILQEVRDELIKDSPVSLRLFRELFNEELDKLMDDTKDKDVDDDPAESRD